MLNKKPSTMHFKYPGIRSAMDGNTAVIMCERETSDAAGAYPITPSTQMGEFWAEEVSKGHCNISGRPLIFIEPESEHAAAAVTAGMAMTGLRATNFSSAQGVAFMHESLYAATGKRLPYVLNIGCRAITKATLNVHCGHDDYHCIDDTGFIQVMAKSAQEAADLNLIGRKIAELSLTPAAVAQDGFLTTHLIETLNVPERALMAEYLGRPDDRIDTPTPAQKMLYGEKRRRIPAVWDVDNPMLSGSVQNQDAYMQAVAAQRPFFFQHIVELADRCMEEYYQLTGRRYARVSAYRLEDAAYVLLGQGSMVVQAEAVADYLRETRGLKVGVVNLTMYRPFPGDLLSKLLQGKQAVTVLERTDQPLSEDLPLMREIRAVLSKCMENNVPSTEEKPYPKYATYKPGQVPRLYSSAYGLGSRDLQPGDLIGAVENMLPDGAGKPFYYLSIDFIRDRTDSPKQELYMQELQDTYPDIKALVVKGSENPNLMPKGAITVRMHSVGGWGAMTTGKNLAMTLFDLLDYDIKANPKYGSEKKGQPTTYYLSAAPEPIRVNCEYHYVDVVLSPDPNVFDHSNPLNGLKNDGVFIVQNHAETPAEAWEVLPIWAQKEIIKKNIHVFYLDGFKIAREEASNPELQFRMQGIAFQGAFFAASSVMKQVGLNDKTLFQAIEKQLQEKFGAKGKRVVEDNLRVVRRGFEELKEITDKTSSEITAPVLKKHLHLPILLKQQPGGQMRVSDIHRFWEQTGNFYATGQGSSNLADPFIATSLIPASTGVFRDMTQIRFDYPHWIAENCTACGDCYSLCPDSAIPGLVSRVSDVFNSVISKLETGSPTRFLRRILRTVEKKLRALAEAAGENGNVNQLLDQAMLETLAESELQGADKTCLEKECGGFMEVLGDFQFAFTKPYWTQQEKQVKGAGGLFSITVNPYTCKGCMECIAVCKDGALKAVKQTPEAITKLRQDWEFWLSLPTTPQEYIRIDDLNEKAGALHTLLLDKRNYASMLCGDGACLGCGEKTAIHLFTATVTALMQARVKAHLQKIDDLITRLEKHIRLKLMEGMDLSDVSAVHQAIEESKDKDLTLSKLSAKLTEEKAISPVDTEWLEWAVSVLNKLNHLKWQYTTGITNNGRANLGFINATGCTSVWGSTYPYNPYPFPWASHLFQDSPSMAMGLFEGHMAKMAEGFKAIRMAELELAGEYHPEKHREFFSSFNWKQFTDEEFFLCPPVVSVGGDGAMYDIGFQNLSRMLMSGMPIKVLVLDTQVYSNTGGQACTSGFISQVADMTPYGKAWKGKHEIRKELALIAMGHRTAFVLQSAISNLTHLLEGYIDGLNSRCPALFNIYAVCQPEHGVGDDASHAQSKLAVESRAYPLYVYNPSQGTSFAECSSLEGNPSIETDWPRYKLSHVDENGKESELEVSFTFADFAATEARFCKHFKKSPPETWAPNMVPISEFLELDEDEREDKQPFIWTVDDKKRLRRAVVSPELVKSTEERRTFWRQLKGLCGLDNQVDVEAVMQQTKMEMAQKLTASLLSLADSSSAREFAASLVPSSNPGNGNELACMPNKVGAIDYEPVWVETQECTACDECININPKIFAYNADKKAMVINPTGGPYKDIVKAAEKCTAHSLHPGTPFNRNEPGVEKLIKRAAKYQ